MKEQLERLLLYHGYEKITTNLDELTLYFGYTQSMVYAVAVFDCMGKVTLTMQQLSHIKEQSANLFEQKGYQNVHILTLFLTDTYEETKAAFLGEKDLWLVDTFQKRLYILENQPDDFYGLKSIIKKALSGWSVPEERVQTEYKEEPTISDDTDQKKRGGSKNLILKNYSTVNFIIIIINILFFIYLELNGNTEDVYYMLEKGALYFRNVIEDAEYYRLFTSMFMHYGFYHLMGNMLVLFFLGDNVDRAVGRIKYLIIYFGCGLLAAAASMFYSFLTNSASVSAGASGAIFGITGAMVWILIKNKGKLEEMDLFRMMLFIGYSLYSGFTSESVDNIAHLAGLFSGILLAMLLYRLPSKEEFHEH